MFSSSLHLIIWVSFELGKFSESFSSLIWLLSLSSDYSSSNWFSKDNIFSLVNLRALTPCFTTSWNIKSTYCENGHTKILTPWIFVLLCNNLISFLLFWSSKLDYIKMGTIYISNFNEFVHIELKNTSLFFDFEIIFW